LIKPDAKILREFSQRPNGLSGFPNPARGGSPEALQKLYGTFGDFYGNLMDFYGNPMDFYGPSVEYRGFICCGVGRWL
jgi:hypothetical protein